MAMRAASGVDAYIADFPPAVRATLRKVRATIRKAAPEAEEAIRYGMPGYRLEARALVYFAAFKDHWSLFALPSAQTRFAKRLARYRTSKGTARFPYDEPVPEGLVTAIVRFRVKENRAAAAARALRTTPRRTRVAKRAKPRTATRSRKP